MSQYFATSKNKRKVLYGFDAPTGGYFFMEILNDEEVETDGADISQNGDGLTLTELEKSLKDLGVNSKIFDLIADFNGADFPTPLQIQISSTFGKDLYFMLSNVLKDLEENYGYHQNESY